MLSDWYRGLFLDRDILHMRIMRSLDGAQRGAILTVAAIFGTAGLGVIAFLSSAAVSSNATLQLILGIVGIALLLPLLVILAFAGSATYTSAEHVMPNVLRRTAGIIQGCVVLLLGVVLRQYAHSLRAGDSTWVGWSLVFGYCALFFSTVAASQGRQRLIYLFFGSLALIVLMLYPLGQLEYDRYQASRRSMAPVDIKADSSFEYFGPRTSPLYGYTLDAGGNVDGLYPWLGHHNANTSDAKIVHPVSPESIDRVKRYVRSRQDQLRQLQEERLRSDQLQRYFGQVVLSRPNRRLLIAIRPVEGEAATGEYKDAATIIRTRLVAIAGANEPVWPADAFHNESVPEKIRSADPVIRAVHLEDVAHEMIDITTVVRSSTSPNLPGVHGGRCDITFARVDVASGKVIASATITGIEQASSQAQAIDRAVRKAAAEINGDVFGGTSS